MPVSRDQGSSRVRPRRARAWPGERRPTRSPSPHGRGDRDVVDAHGHVTLTVDGGAVEQLAEHAQLARLLLVAAKVEARARELDPGRGDRIDAARADEDRLAADRDEQAREPRRATWQHRHDDVVHAADALSRRVVDRQTAQLRREHPHGRITP